MEKRNTEATLLLLLLFLLLALSVGVGVTSGAESWVYGKMAMHATPCLTDFVKRVTHLGDSPVIMRFCLLLYIIPKIRRMFALPVSSAALLSFGINFELKRFFARERPNVLQMIPASGYSFPSGHAMNSAAVCTMLTLLILPHVRKLSGKLAVCIFFGTLAVLVGLSRVYLGVHYAGDVLGGWLLGTVVALFIDSIGKEKQPGQKLTCKACGR